MKKYVKYFGLAFLSMVFILSCTKTEIGYEPPTPKGTDFFKSTLLNGYVVANYKYNDLWKITEYEGIFTYIRYIYDDQNKLIRRESSDRSMNPDFRYTEGTELMTAENCTTTSYSVYKYDPNGVLDETENYLKIGDDFELRSITRFDFEKGKIVGRSICLPSGKVASFTAYQYDENGNVSNEKHYSSFYSENGQLELTSETTYKYDNKRNPYKILEAEGYPGLFSNTNNEIQANSIILDLLQNESSQETTTISYEYNSNGYPLKSSTSMHEYTYYRNVQQ